MINVSLDTLLAYAVRSPAATLDIRPFKGEEKFWGITRARLQAPREMPVDADVSAEALARDFPRRNGGTIRNAILRAASRAALRRDRQRVVRMAGVRAAAREEERCSGAPKVVGSGASEGQGEPWCPCP